jgi:hypothetical protein
MTQPQTPTVAQPQTPAQPAVSQPPAPVGAPPQMPTASQSSSPASGAAPANPQIPSIPAAHATPVGSAQPSIADSERGSAVLLLDRIQRVLDDAVDGMSDQVKIDRGLIDEMRAELTQVKMTLQRQKQ